MKKITFLFLLFFYTLMSYAQIFSFQQVIGYDESNDPILKEIPNEGSIFVTERDFLNELVGTVMMNNVSQKDIDLGVSAYRESILEGSVERFCLIQCYNSNGEVEQHYPPQPFTLAANTEMEISFHCKSPEEGDNIVRYEFYDKNTPSENRFTFKVIYRNQTSGVSELENDTYNFITQKKGENPKFNYFFSNNKERKLIIHDITGKLANNIIINSLQGNIEFTSLNKGLYIYSIIEEGKVIKSNKFVVN